jgi:hypothetical protein
MSERVKAILYTCVVCGLIGFVFGLAVAESDIKRDCDHLERVVLHNQSYVCGASK